MLETLFFGILGISIIMTILSVIDKEEIAWPVMAIPSWIVTAVLVNNLERMAVFMLPDGTTQLTTIEYHSGAFLIYFFLGFALVFIAIFFHRVSDIMLMRKKEREKLGT